MKDSRLPEVAWLVVIAILVAAGGPALLGFLGENRIGGGIVVLVAITAAIVMLRRAYVPSSPTVRADVTQASAYCIAAILAFVTIEWNPHWALRACISAAEVAIIFDIVTVVARRPAVPKET